MLRDLATVIEELRDGLTGIAKATRAGVRVSKAEMTLPIDVVPIFRNGGASLLADVRRAHADSDWRGPASRLHIVFEERIEPGESP